jgi:pimeloyl-ACP methyl ester carboxylesterase
MEAEVEALRQDPSPIASLDVGRIVDHYERIIRRLDSPPIIVGHSFGGAFTQILLNRGLGAAGVGIASGTVKGVPDLPLSTIRVTFPVLRNPFNRGKAVPLSAGQFHYAFANTLSRPEPDEIYRRYHVPAAATVLFEGALANFSPGSPLRVDFSKDRAPMLFVAFEDDHIIPPSVSRHNAEKYAPARAVTAFQTFPGRPHCPGVPGWEEVADYALDWATSHAATARAAGPSAIPLTRDRVA